MKDIKITVTKKVASVEGTPIIVCGNSDYTLSFTFDDEWSNEQNKVARFSFVKNGLKRFIDMPVHDNTCQVPVLIGIGLVRVGVYAGNLKTTTGAKIKCYKSILCDDADTIDEPFENLYEELMEKIEGIDGSGGQGSLKEVERPNVWELESGAYLVKGGFYWATPRPPVFQNFKEATNCFLLVSVDQYDNNQRKYYAIIDNDVYYGFSCENGINVDTGEHTAEGECNKQIVTTVNPAKEHTNEQVYGAKALDETFVAIDEMLQEKQAELVSGENIKTINGESILGKGDLSVSGGSAEVWEHICDISVKSEDALTVIGQNLGGSFRKVLIKIALNGTRLTEANTTMRFFLNGYVNAAAVARIATDGNAYRTYLIDIEYMSLFNLYRGSVSWYGWYGSGMEGVASVYRTTLISSIHIALDSSTFLTNTYEIYGVKA